MIFLYISETSWPLLARVALNYLQFASAMSFDPKVLAIAAGALGFLYIMAVEPLNPKTKRQDALANHRIEAATGYTSNISNVFGRYIIYNYIYNYYN